MQQIKTSYNAALTVFSTYSKVDTSAISLKDYKKAIKGFNRIFNVLKDVDKELTKDQEEYNEEIKRINDLSTIKDEEADTIKNLTKDEKQEIKVDLLNALNKKAKEYKDSVAFLLMKEEIEIMKTFTEKIFDYFKDIKKEQKVSSRDLDYVLEFEEALENATEIKEDEKKVETPVTEPVKN